MKEAQKGYYINCLSIGGARGPKARELIERARAETPEGTCPLYGSSSTVVQIVYGNPVVGEFQFRETVRPIEKAYSLLRYDDPRERSQVYITRHHPSTTVWSADENAQPVPSTPEMCHIFESLVPEWERQNKLLLVRIRRALNRGIRRAGLAKTHRPKNPGYDASEEDTNKFIAASVAFERKVLEHVRPPKPLLVRIEGIDEILMR